MFRCLERVHLDSHQRFGAGLDGLEERVGLGQQLGEEEGRRLDLVVVETRLSLARRRFASATSAMRAQR